MQASMAATKRADGCAAMGAEIVPEHDDVSTEMAQQVTEEGADPGLADIVERELVVQPQALAARTDRDPGDHRDPIVPVAMMDDRSAAPWGPRATDTGDQEEARFVGKDEMGAQPPGVFLTRGHSFFFQCSILASSRSQARRAGL